MPLKAEIDNAHMQTRMACKFANGNERAPHLLDFWIEECSVSGEVLKVFKTGLGELGSRGAVEGQESADAAEGEGREQKGGRASWGELFERGGERGARGRPGAAAASGSSQTRPGHSKS